MMFTAEAAESAEIAIAENRAVPGAQLRKLTF